VIVGSNLGFSRRLVFRESFTAEFILFIVVVGAQTVGVPFGPNFLLNTASQAGITAGDGALFVVNRNQSMKKGGSKLEASRQALARTPAQQAKASYNNG
jgi:hypothetical protein